MKYLWKLKILHASLNWKIQDMTLRRVGQPQIHQETRSGRPPPVIKASRAVLPVLPIRYSISIPFSFSRREVQHDKEGILVSIYIKWLWFGTRVEVIEFIAYPKSSRLCSSLFFRSHRAKFRKSITSFFLILLVGVHAGQKKCFPRAHQLNLQNSAWQTFKYYGSRLPFLE